MLQVYLIGTRRKSPSSATVVRLGRGVVTDTAIQTIVFGGLLRCGSGREVSPEYSWQESRYCFC